MEVSVTIKDIAKAAGVSITTVSRALNGYSDVNEETRRKIFQIAEAMGYSPNMAARSLIVKRTKTLGLLISGITRTSVKDSIAFEILCGTNDRAGELNYDLVLFNTDTQKQKMKSYKSLCLERGVDGVIIMGIRLDDPYLEEVVNSNIPCVLIDIPLTGEGVSSVNSDSVNGARIAVDYLIKCGHRHIGMINGHAQAFVSKGRLEGYRKALDEHGIPFREQYVEDGGFTESGGAEAAVRLLSRNPDITALFCASDLMAIGAIQAIRNMGKSVPEDISVVGYDNIGMSEYLTPPLTTVKQDHYRMGYQATQMLIDMLEGRNVHPQVIIPAELVMRGSVRAIG
jgi:LacI family transcriptional regulator